MEFTKYDIIYVGRHAKQIHGQQRNGDGCIARCLNIAIKCQHAGRSTAGKSFYWQLSHLPDGRKPSLQHPSFQIPRKRTPKLSCLRSYHMTLHFKVQKYELTVVNSGRWWVNGIIAAIYERMLCASKPLMKMEISLNQNSAGLLVWSSLLGLRPLSSGSPAKIAKYTILTRLRAQQHNFFSRMPDSFSTWASENTLSKSGIVEMQHHGIFF